MPGKGNGRSLTLGIQMGPSSQARKLVTCKFIALKTFAIYWWCVA